jgi:hypothetical protein
MFKPPAVPEPLQDANAASEVAKIQGAGLTQIWVLDFANFLVWHRGELLFAPQIGSLLIHLDLPDEAHVKLSAALEVKNPDGTFRLLQLLPGTLEITALNRRLRVTCPSVSPFQNLWVELGLNSEGQSSEFQGGRGLHLLLTEGVLASKLVWQDGREEEIFPTGHPVPTLQQLS